jgi:hypothetical protein
LPRGVNKRLDTRTMPKLTITYPGVLLE